MSTQPLLIPRLVDADDDADRGCSYEAVPASADEVLRQNDKGKSEIRDIIADCEPWEGLIVLRRTDDRCSIVGDSPRSVQTARSVAESFGYSKEFVVPLEDTRDSEFQPVPDGILLASVLCLGAVVLLFAATTSYVILTMVA